MRKTIFCILWSILICAVLVVTLGAISIKRGWIGYMSPLEELQNPINKYASQVLSCDGKLLGTWSRSENRVFVDYDSISSHMINALIATEDVRFYDHSGIDIKALFRAIIKRGIFQQKEAGGGSTITQQLAKQLYSSTASSKMERVMQKPIEWVIAAELERYYTKEEILTLYLNYFDFLHNAVGIKTAAQVYFGKHPKDLTITEAALLVGMCKNPSYYNPVRFAERSLSRRNIVLQQMVKADLLTEDEYEKLKTEPLGLKFRRIDHKDGLAPYLREYLRRIMMANKPKRSDYAEWQHLAYFEDSLAWENNPLYGWCKKNTKEDGSNYDIYTDGLKVFTTINSKMQRYAEEAVRTHVGNELQPLFEKEKKGSPNYPYSRALSKSEIEKILNKAMRQSDRYRLMKKDGASESEILKAFNTPTHMTVFTYRGERDTLMSPIDSIKYYKSFLRSGMLSIDPTNGHVKAYVGGVDFAHFQYDMCMMGRRQVGSTMKPFVYSLALEDGMLPTDLVPNEERTYIIPGSASWTPRNGSRARYGELVTLKWGLSQSNNWVTAALMDSVDRSGQRLKDLLGEFGIVNPEIHPSLSLCLGSCDITVAEMASAYTAFANKGIRTAPVLVSRIEDNKGNILAEFQPRMNEVISENSSYYMVDMLKAVVNQGTGYRLRYRYGFEGEIAGKTGTTNSNSDGWFVGFVPRLVNACWVGGEDRDIHFNTTASGQGASTALPIWALYMKKVLADPTLGYSSNEKFAIPADLPMKHEEDLLEDANSEPEESFGGIDALFD